MSQPPGHAPDGDPYGQQYGYGQGQYGNDRDDGPHGSHAVSLTSTVAHTQTGCSSGPGAASAGGGQGGEERGEGNEGMGTDDGGGRRSGAARNFIAHEGAAIGQAGRLRAIEFLNLRPGYTAQWRSRRSRQHRVVLAVRHE